MNIHQNFNLKFVNRTTNSGKIWKECTLNDKNNRTYEWLSIYILQLEYVDDILDIHIPQIDLILNGNNPTEVIIKAGSTHATVSQINTVINDFDEYYSVTIPTQDFKSILQEYANFLNTPPLNGTRV